MHLLVVLTVGLGVLHAHPDPEPEPLEERDWQEWKAEHGRRYDTAMEESGRRDVWLQNKQYIHWRNSQDPGFKLKLNQFADMVRI